MLSEALLMHNCPHFKASENHLLEESVQPRYLIPIPMKPHSVYSTLAKTP